MKIRMWAVAAMVMGLSLAARADLVIPDHVPVSPDDEKAVRAMLGEYVQAVQAGDRAKTLSFCQVEHKADEKLTRLGCEIDFAIATLRSAVERKLGKDAWGRTGEKLGEMTPDAMKTIEVHPTASADEVTVSWNENSKLPPEKRLTGEVNIRRTKQGWRFALIDETGTRIAMRRWLRDTIAEIVGLAGEVEQAKIATREDLDKAVDLLIKEAKTQDQGQPEKPEAEPAVPDPMLVVPPGIDQ